MDEGIRLGVTVTPAFCMRDQLIVGRFFYRPFHSSLVVLKFPIK